MTTIVKFKLYHAKDPRNHKRGFEINPEDVGDLDDRAELMKFVQTVCEDELDVPVHWVPVDDEGCNVATPDGEGWYFVVALDEEATIRAIVRSYNQPEEQS